MNLIISLIKLKNMFLDGPTYFSMDSKNHSSDNTWLQKKYCILLN